MLNKSELTCCANKADEKSTTFQARRGDRNETNISKTHLQFLFKL